MAQTAETYYGDERLYGGYQYISLKEIIDEMLIDTTDTDNYLKNTKRSRIIVAAKNGIRELNREVKKTVLAAEITVGPTLYMAVPQDYVDWVRVSVIGEDFKLVKLRENNKIPTAVGYLQDNKYKILFDSNGEILKADSSNVFNKKWSQAEFCVGSSSSKIGEFVIDERRGVIAFSSDLEGKEILIEYISDGLQQQALKEEEITIHKVLKTVLMDYIYMTCIDRRQHVPQNEKTRARNRYLKNLHVVKVDKANFSINEMIRTISLAPKIR